MLASGQHLALFTSQLDEGGDRQFPQALQLATQRASDGTRSAEGAFVIEEGSQSDDLGPLISRLGGEGDDLRFLRAVVKARTLPRYSFTVSFLDQGLWGW